MKSEISMNQLNKFIPSVEHYDFFHLLKCGFSRDVYFDYLDMLYLGKIESSIHGSLEKPLDKCQLFLINCKGFKDVK